MNPSVKMGFLVMVMMRYMRLLLLFGVMVLSPLGPVKSDEGVSNPGFYGAHLSRGEEVIAGLRFSKGRAYAKLAEFAFKTDRERALRLLEKAWDEAQTIKTPGTYSSVIADITAVAARAGETKRAIDGLTAAVARLLDVSLWPQKDWDQNLSSAVRLIDVIGKRGAQDKARPLLAKVRHSVVNDLLSDERSELVSWMVDVHLALDVGSELRPLLLLARNDRQRHPVTRNGSFKYGEGLWIEGRVVHHLAFIAVDFARVGLAEDAWETFEMFADSAVDTRAAKKGQVIADFYFRILMALEGPATWNPLSPHQDDAWHFEKATP